MATLDPAAYANSADPYPWRGYAAIGYFPAFNLGASAGYRLIDHSHTTLDAWMQYDGASWHHNVDIPSAEMPTRINLRRHQFSIGAHATHHFSHTSTLEANIGYGFTNRTSPADQLLLDRNSRSINRLNIDLGWESSIGRKFTYGASLKYGLTAYNAANVVTAYNSVGALTENTIALELEGAYSFTKNIYVGLDIEAYANALNHSAPTKGAVGLRPHFGWHSDNFSARLGINLDMPFLANDEAYSHVHGMEASTNVFPDIRIAWTPSGSFTVWGKLDGYTEANSLSSLFDYSIYSYDAIYGFSDVSLDLEAGITLGPWRGASLELRGGYAKTKHWLLPSLDPSGYWFGLYEASDLSGLHYGATVSYSYRSLLDIHASLDGAPHNGTRGWFLWRDRSRWVADVALDLHPISPLTITLGHNWRLGRRCEGEVLGNISSLRLGAAYRITQQWSVFARGENILNHHNLIMPGLPDQGVNGLIGITYKIK
jgi:hypothetical protein